jgi:hypothetical protein
MTTLLYSCHSKQDTRLVFRPEFRSAMPNCRMWAFRMILLFLWRGISFQA